MEMNLVTGASGLVGSHVTMELLRRGCRVRVLLRNKASAEKMKRIFSYYGSDYKSLFDKTVLCYGDMLDRQSLVDAFRGVGRVYHCAAKVSFDPSDKADIIDTNINGTAGIVNLCIENNIEKLVHISSIAAIGNSGSDETPGDESTWPGTHNSWYAYSKTLSEMEVWRGMAEGLNAVVVNPSVVLGPGNWEEGSSQMFHRIYRGMKFYTRGVTGYVDVRDVAEVAVMLMNSNVSGERFILNAANLSYRDIFTKIASAMQVPAPRIYAGKALTGIAWKIEKLRTFIFGGTAVITRQTAKTSHKKQYYSAEKIAQLLNYKFRPLDQSISDFAGFYMNETGSG